jgi:hypothetical protein
MVEYTNEEIRTNEYIDYNDLYENDRQAESFKYELLLALYAIIDDTDYIAAKTFLESVLQNAYSDGYKNGYFTGREVK